MPGEQLASDMVAVDPFVRFRGNVFRRVVDQITTRVLTNALVKTVN
jgi:hypothetical protein